MKCYDMNGNLTTLSKLVRDEPEWACSRLIEMEQEITELRANLKVKLTTRLAPFMTTKGSELCGMRTTKGKFDE